MSAAEKARREQDGIQAFKDYEAEQARVDANTQRLRALRLAKEAGDTPVQTGIKRGGTIKPPAGKRRAGPKQ